MKTNIAFNIAELLFALWGEGMCINYLQFCIYANMMSHSTKTASLFI